MQGATDMFRFIYSNLPPQKTKMTMEHPPFEDVLPIEN